MKETRKKSYVENAPQGYERKVNYKEWTNEKHRHS
jgi:hypothetical protein